ncbi:MAG: 4Fe-4S dicluster domain-containing protein [Proteobacteria bacterium]|nr:4Fe-4S dicluster domain-containing protein [Pseudomonadota bacterium]MBU1688892.1 4Fe-4S dicluster domain-containing protein [Pseudomonadota bacterium]
MSVKKTELPEPTDAKSPEYWQKKTELDQKGLKRFRQILYSDWCKGCGICIAFCPKQVFSADETGKPLVMRANDCIGCRFCEIHCPDFAVAIEEKYPDRRRGSDEER